jgi:thiamine kinase-like enzyme
MRFILNKTNVFTYLHEQGIYNCPETTENQIELKPAKNFNLLVTLTDDYQLLVKQERHNSYGQTAGEFINEWRLHRLVRVYPELANIRSLISELIHFNPEQSVIIFKYLTNYIDLSIFYDKESVFPLEIANSLGYTLATIHQATFNRLEYRDFLTPIPQELLVAQELKRITPEILAKIPVDGVQFFKLYQKYDSLGKAIAQLIESFKPCCLTHNDLKLNNILLLNNWQQVSQAQAPASSHLVRLIDWERCGWGDPAFDLGAMQIFHYLLNTLHQG